VVHPGQPHHHVVGLQRLRGAPLAGGLAGLDPGVGAAEEDLRVVHVVALEHAGLDLEELLRVADVRVQLRRHL